MPVRDALGAFAGLHPLERAAVVAELELDLGEGDWRRLVYADQLDEAGAA